MKLLLEKTHILSEQFIDGESIKQLKCWLSVYSNNLSALHCYRKQGVVDQIFLIQATERFVADKYPIIQPATLTEWRSHSKQEIQYLQMKGHHYSILADDNVLELAKQIKLILQQIDMQNKDKVFL